MILLQRKRHRARLVQHAALIERWKNDRVGFAAELDVLDKDGERIAIRPSAMILAFETQRAGWDIVLKPRQVWFTTWELAQDIWYWLTQPGARVVVVCQSDKDDEAVKELHDRVRVMLGTDDASLLEPSEKRGLTGKHPDLGITFARGRWWFGSSSLRIIGAGASKAAAEKKGRAGTIHRLHITEISSFEHAESTMNAILECVPTSNPNAEVVIESTPRGASGLFYRYYTEAKRKANSFQAFFFAWMKHPEYRTRLDKGEVVKVQTPREREMVRKHGASAEQIKWYRDKVANKTQDLADQEYPMDEETCWLIAGRLFLNAERTKLLLSESRDPARIEALRGSVPDPTIQNELRIWREPKHEKEQFILVADPSEGVVGGDPCAAAVYARATGEHVATVHGLWRTHEFAGVLEKVGLQFNKALIAIERINHGHAVLNALLRLGIREADVPRGKPYPNVYVDGEDGKAGWKTGTVQRATAMEAFEAAHRTGEWSSPDRDALAEMQRFVINKLGKPEAAYGAHDDRVLTHVIAWTVLAIPQTQGSSNPAGDEYRWGSDDRGFG